MKPTLCNRLQKFSLSVIFFLRDLPSDVELKGIKTQLIAAATSAGANYEEAQAATSRADFKNKVAIALKEMREANYWLRILAGLGAGNATTLQNLLQESKELTLILGSIASKVVVKPK